MLRVSLNMHLHTVFFTCDQGIAVKAAPAPAPAPAANKWQGFALAWLPSASLSASSLPLP